MCYTSLATCWLVQFGPKRHLPGNQINIFITIFSPVGTTQHKQQIYPDNQGHAVSILSVLVSDRTTCPADDGGDTGCFCRVFLGRRSRHIPHCALYTGSIQLHTHGDSLSRFLTGGFLIRFLQYISLPKDNDSYPKWPTNNGRILLMLAAVTLCPQQYMELSTSLSLKTHRHT